MLKIQFPHNPSLIGGPGSFQIRFSEELIKNGIRILEPSSKERPDIIFVVGGTKRVLWLLINKIKKVKIVHRIDGLDSNFKLEICNLKFNVLKLIRNLNVLIIANFLADNIIFQSWYISEYWKSFLINNFVKKIVIYNGVNVDYFKPYNIGKKNEIICVEGSINSNYAIEILNSIKLYKITLVGNIEKSFRTKITNQNISYLGVIDRKKIPEILNQHCIYLCLEPNPPCPNSVIEALSCGLPVVGFNTGSLDELVNSSGLLSSLILLNDKPTLSSINDVENKIKKIFENYELYTKLARENALINFDIKKITQEYIDFIQ